MRRAAEVASESHEEADEVEEGCNRVDDEDVGEVALDRGGGGGAGHAKV